MSHPETRVLHEGDGPRADAQPLTVPIYGSTTFVFRNADDLDAYNRGEQHGYLYSRHANPTVEAAESQLVVLEAGEAAVVTASGMAAISTALFGTLRAGDELVTSAALYGGTQHLLDTFLGRFGVTVRPVPIEALASPAGVIGPATKVLWFETPINPTLRCVDIRKIAAACRGRGVVSVVDSTFASPINQQPLTMGVDVVMHSATKYLNGHSDVIAGALVGSAAIIEPLRTARKLLGGVLDPAAAYALVRGMKTIGVRVARQNGSADRVARWLEADSRVSRVFYPGLPSHPDHAIAASQMVGFGGMVTFEAAGGVDAARRLFDAVSVFQRATSLGGVESLISLPAASSHYGLTQEVLDRSGVTPGMVRLSIGLEHPDDLIGDLDRALGSRL